MCGMKLLILAGEESGVHYADRIADAVRARRPDAEIRGYGDYGFKTADLAVFGIWAVLRRIFFFLRVKRTMERAIAEWRPDVVCTIDYPGMNLKLAAFAKARGVKAVHVVCPQVWAWHQGRIPRIERSLDRLCCFFPFEPGLFRPGLAEFVGHPLAQEFAKGALDEGRREKGLVALLPGSRLGEIEKHLPTLLEAVAPLKGVRVAIPAANDRARAAIDRIVAVGLPSAEGIGVLYTLIARLLPGMSTVASEPNSTLVEIRRYMRENPRIRIPDLARHCRMSESGLYAYVKRHTGMTPIAMHNSIKAATAAELLASTDMKIEDVASRLGFESTAYFRKIFKATHGKTPSEIKRQRRLI